MRLVQLQKSDCGALARLHARCFERGWSAMEIAALVNEPGVIALAAGPAQPMGFILLRVVLDEAEVLTLAVDPDHRRSGLARQLLDEAVSRSRLAGARTVFLEVSTGNDAAIALYESADFTEGGIRRRYYADGSDARVMEKTLDE